MVGRALVLDPGSRLAFLTASVDGRAYPQIHGLHRFQRWVTDSGRVAESAGSPWWSEVNERILLDMTEAATAWGAHQSKSSPAVQAWTEYWTSPTTNLGRTRLCWRAHQLSLTAAAEAAADLLRIEPPAERAFIAAALSAVALAARCNLPMGRIGSVAVGAFCRLCYPQTYPATDASGGGAGGGPGDPPLSRARLLAALIGRRFAR